MSLDPFQGQKKAPHWSTIPSCSEARDLGKGWLFFLGAFAGFLAGAFLFGSHARAAELDVHWGFEGKSAIERGLGKGEKDIGLGLVVPFGSAKQFLGRLAGGSWINAPATPSRETSGYAELQVGYRVSLPWGLSIDALVGPAWIGAVDEQLGSPWQISHSIRGYWRSDVGNGVGLFCNHKSDAGLSGRANLGRNTCGAHFSITF